MAKKKIGTSPFDAACDYLASKPRTIREVELHLDKCDFGEYEIYAAVERLKELNYLNDEKYAHDFIESRLNTKPVSRRKLRQQLKGHMLCDDIIDEALAKVSDETEEENARAVAEKFTRQFSHIEEAERGRRVAKRLLSRGYDYSLVREIMHDVDIDACNFEDEDDYDE